MSQKVRDGISFFERNSRTLAARMPRRKGSTDNSYKHSAHLSFVPACFKMKCKFIHAASRQGRFCRERTEDFQRRINMKHSNYFKELKESIQIIYECTPLYTILKILSKLLLAVMVPLQLIVIQQVINAVLRVLDGAGKEAAWLWCGLFLTLDVLVIALTHLDSLFQCRICEMVNQKITCAIVKKFCTVEYHYLEEKQMNDTVNLMGKEPDVKLVERFVHAVNAVCHVITLTGATLFLAQVSLGLMSGFGFMLILTVFYNYKGMDMMNDIIAEQTTDERRLQYMSDMLSDKSMLYELKVYRGIDYIVQKWRKEAKRIFGARLKVILRAQRFFIWTTVLFILWAAAAAFVFAGMLFARQIGLGLFSAFVLSVASLMDNTVLLSNELSAMRRNGIEAGHYERFMGLPDAKEGSRKLTEGRYHIEFKNVSFSYPSTERQILKNVSFSFESGETVALVGENGSGKSTLIKLLLGLYHPDSGSIYVNQCDLCELDQETKRALFGVIFQDYTKYFLTLRENVALGNLDYLENEEKIIRALEKGMAEDVLKMGEQGLAMNLGKLEEDGVDLSGGQWQRVALARALISDAAFIILDEPTAAMDPIAESRMYDSFFEVMQERGSIMVSHRLASAKMADKIIVLRDGRVCEMGSHAELMKKKGFYCDMYMQQSAWYQTEGKI